MVDYTLRCWKNARATALGHTQLAETLKALTDDEVLFHTRTELCNIMTDCGSDKGSNWHNYTVLYHALFDAIRPDVGTLCEIGIGTNYTDITSNMGSTGRPGASLRGWRDYFPKALIFGADIDTRILFSEDRIGCAYVDQLKPETISALWDNLGVSGFDIIIDDGLHTFEANRCLFENSIHRVKPGGTYVIEDIVLTNENLLRFMSLFINAPYEIYMAQIHHPVNSHDNCMAIIRT